MRQVLRVLFFTVLLIGTITVDFRSYDVADYLYDQCAARWLPAIKSNVPMTEKDVTATWRLLKGKVVAHCTTLEQSICAHKVQACRDYCGDTFASDPAGLTACVTKDGGCEDRGRHCREAYYCPSGT